MTNKKEKTYGIEEVGTRFELPMNNGTIVGFHGRAGQLLDSLGVFIIKVCKVIIILFLKQMWRFDTSSVVLSRYVK